MTSVSNTDTLAFFERRGDSPLETATTEREATRRGLGVSDCVLRVEGLSVSFSNDRPRPDDLRGGVLDGVDFALRPGRLTALIGPNGAGKSTLLRAILGLLPRGCADGRVAVAGNDRLHARRRSIAYVPQRETVDWDFPICVREVVETGLLDGSGSRGVPTWLPRWLRRPSAADRERARTALDRVGLSDKAEQPIGALSGGQQQRVFLARALVQDAPLYLMDEALSGVDAVSEQIAFDLLRELCAAGRSVVVVHHDLSTVRARFDDVLLLNRSLVAHGPIADCLRPEVLERAYGTLDRPVEAATAEPR